TLTPSTACRRDVGIAGAKIAVCVDCVGTLQESPFGLGSRQTNTPGLRHIVYRVQNFDSTTAANLQVTVSVSSRAIGPEVYTYTTDLTSATPLALASGAAATGSVPFTFVAGRDYMVSINATPTSYSGETNTQNNSRLFRFIVQ
ncbi:MAG TPA: hypothetical protein VFS23_04620, partial [Vicinamibacterales bacterium]|nr:hypothetical protein [Vicinamibacterales bacterium]